MHRILFVCTGNTCRSPMAEAILKNKQLPNIEVRSAGVYAMDGMQASVNAQIVLSGNNIEHNHTSKLLTQDDLNWATHVLTMTGSHKANILQSFSSASTKTYTLQEFAGTSNSDVQDPYGGSVNIYQKTFEELEGLVDNMIKRLNNG